MDKSSSIIPVAAQFSIENIHSRATNFAETVFVQIQLLNAHIPNLLLAVPESLKAISAGVLTPNFSAIRAL